MKNAQLIAEVAALKAQVAALSARPAQRPSDLKIVATTDIPSKGGKKWATVEITDMKTGEVTKCFLDHAYDAKPRTDGAKQHIMYATRMPEAPAKDAPAKPAPVEDAGSEEDMSFGRE